MKSLTRLAFALAVVLLTPMLFAEEISIGDRGTFFSEILQEERALSISLPASYEGSEAIYPVVYLLDPGTRFHHTTGTLSSLAQSGHIPEFIVVGVHNTDRTRDLTPPWTADDIPEDRVQLIETGGGGDDFLRFFREELIPHVDETFRTAPFRVLVGHSFGGLLAVHAFVTEPDLFDATLAISPSLWWDDGLSIDRAQALFQENPGLSGHLYLTIANEGGDMQVEFTNMSSLLRYQAPAGLRWETHILDGEDHGSVPVPSVHSGFRFFFPRWGVPGFAREAGLEGVDRHYATLSQEYGYEISTPEAIVNNLGYQSLGNQRIDDAIAIFETNVERYPGSANVYDSLGEGIEAAGRLEEALELYQRACKIGAESNDPNLAAYQAHVDAVTEALQEK